MKVLIEAIRKDLRVFFSDRRAVMISVGVPIVIASFMATLFGGMNGGQPTRKIVTQIVDQDRSAISAKVIAELKSGETIQVLETTEEKGREAVQRGDQAMLLVIPAKFGEQASAAMRGGGEKPKLAFVVDPSKSLEAQVAKGTIMGVTMRSIAKESFGGFGGGDTNTAFTFDEQKESSSAENTKAATVTHAFLGMGVQGILFWAIEAAMGLMRERRQGLWKRVRAAPVPLNTILAARALSVAVRGVAILTILFLFGMAVFHMRVNGSWPGLIAVWICSAIMVGGFGLLIASLGKTEQQSRGLATMVVLGMTMLSGAWFPTFMMPAWVQTATKVIPARWAVDGMDMTSWRGLGLVDIAPHCGVLLAFGVAFFLLSTRRFRVSAAE